MLRLLDFHCKQCDGYFERLIDLDKEKTYCEHCHIELDQCFPRKSPSFRLKYNNQTDLCDWQGNTSRYWDEYKKMKAEGKNPRIPSLDGE